MIFDIDGKHLAFGMRWKALLTGDAHKEARAAKAQLMWYDGRATQLGMLIDGDISPIKSQTIYAGAIALARAHPNDKNIFFVTSVPDSKEYVVSAIWQGRPRPDYDVVGVDAQEVTRMFDDFCGLCGEDELLILGNAPLSGIHEYSLSDIADSADQRSVLKKVSGLPIKPIKLLVIIAVLGAIGFGSKSYMDYRKREKQRAAAMAQKSAQDLYAESLAEKRNLPAVRASDVGPWLQWVRALPISVGGWKFKAAICNVTEGKKIACNLDYERGATTQATFQTFVDDAPKLFDGINFDFAAKVIHATTTIQTVKFTQIGNAIDGSGKQRDEIIEFGSVLQTLSGMGDQKLGNFSAFGMPSGVAVDQLTQLPVLAAPWEFNGPLRAIEALEKFPAYATISQFGLTIGNSPQYAYNNSLAKIVLSGSIYAH